MHELKKLNKILNIELAIVIAFVMASAGGAFFILYKHNAITDEIMVQMEFGENFWILKDIISQQNYHGDEFRYTGIADYKEKFLSNGDQFNSAWQRIKDQPIRFKEDRVYAEEIKDLQDYHDRFQGEYLAIFNDVRDNTLQAEENLRTSETGIFKNKTEEIINRWQAVNAGKILKLNQEMKGFVKNAFFGLLVFFVFSSAGFIYISRGFFSPFIKKLLVNLTSGTKDLEEAKESLEEAKNVLEVRVRARTRELKDLAESLEGQIQERTKKLQDKIKELERFQGLTLGRELKMVELKKEIEKLKEELERSKR